MRCRDTTPDRQDTWDISRERGTAISTAAGYSIEQKHVGKGGKRLFVHTFTIPVSSDIIGV